MKGRIEQLGQPPVWRACMGDIEVINLGSLVSLHTRTNLLEFCHWASQVMGQGMHFVAGTYANQGVMPRSEWAFWAPVRSPSGNDGESIFVATQVEEGALRFQLHFYGEDEQLHETLKHCVLRAGVGLGTRYRYVLGFPQKSDDAGVPVTSFEVQVKARGIFTLSLLTAAQFD